MIKNAIKFLSGFATLSNANIALNLAKTIYSNTDNSKFKQNKNIVDKIQKAQLMLNNLMEVSENNIAQRYVNQINANNSDPEWGPYKAEVAKDKFGQGNDGVNLKFRTDAMGIPLAINYRPESGTAGFNFGPFELNL